MKGICRSVKLITTHFLHRKEKSELISRAVIHFYTSNGLIIIILLCLETLLTTVPFHYSSSTVLAIIIATDLVLSFSSSISRAIMMIGAPIIAPAIPQT